jgi:hypothetical protein
MRTRRSYLFFATLALTLAACGGGVADDDPASLPVNDDPASSGGAAAGACLAGEPDCNDIGDGQGAEPLPLPGDGEPGDAPPAGAPDALTISQALETEGVVVVAGFFFDDGSGPRLCEALAESFPPQCGGTSIAVTGYEEVIDVPLQSEQGVSWTDQTVTFTGEIVDGVMVVDPTVAG